jgi:hypothetical protein
MTDVDKENTAVSANVTPPPALVPVDEKKRKSSVKRVRFSLDESKGPSPLRLNNDLLPDESVPSRTSVASRRSSVSDSPVTFPSQQDLLAPTNIKDAPLASPGDSRQSTGSSVNVLSSALSSFANVSSILQPVKQKSIWDTPSSSNYAKNNRPLTGPVSAVPLNLSSPVRRDIRKSAATPGDDRRLFGFQVLTDGTDSCEASARAFRKSVAGDDSTAPVVVSIDSPIQRTANEDDPLLLSGVSSVVQQRIPPSGASSFGTDIVTPGSGATSGGSKRRRRRRLSSLEEIEKELINSASPSPREPNLTKPSSLGDFLVSRGIEFDRIMGERIDLKELLVLSVAKRETSKKWDQVLQSVSNLFLLNVCLQREKSSLLTWDAGVHDMVEEIEQCRSDLIREFGRTDLNETALTQEMEEKFEAAVKFAESQGKQILLNVLEAHSANMNQVFSKIEKYGDDLEAMSREIKETQTQCEALQKTIVEYGSQFDDELNCKYIPGPNGSYERRKSEPEKRLDKLDTAVKEKENEIKDLVTEITDLESRLAEKEAVYLSGYNAMRSFYLDHGWNVVAELRGSVVICYSVCHLVVFERARNNPNYWCLDRIIPCKLQEGRVPSYAPNVLNDQFRYSPGLILQQLATNSQLVKPFRYTPQSLNAIMSRTTTTLCELIEMREAIAKILASPDSVMRINSNFQLEGAIIVMNNSLGIDVPLMVKLLWFDPMFVPEQPVRFNNFSYIVTDTLNKYFPTVRTQIDERFGLIKGDPLSFQMLSDIVKAIHSVLINAQCQE